MKSIVILQLWVFIFALIFTFGAPRAGNAAELPISRVVLFSSGVGSFEHTGEVTGDADVELFFNSDQINDVLKSMVISDLDGGHVAGAAYPSRDPLVRALQSFAVDLSDSPSLSTLLSRLRGAEVAVYAPEPITGRILNVEVHERKSTSATESTVVKEWVVNLVTEDGIHPLPLSAVSRIQLADEAIRNELAQALDVLAGSFDTDRKPVAISLRGTGTRRVRVAYILETPVWKTSYRLDLGGDSPLLQGWAIVENSSDNDWRKIKLELVSGRPISFIQDLYTPLYLPRPVVEPETYAALEPQKYEEGIEAAQMAEKPLAAPAAPATRQLRKMVSAEPAAAPMMKEMADTDFALDRGVASVAQTGKLGELFHFAMSQPVSLSRHRSAMFPIVNSTIEAEKLSVYNQSVLPGHPLNGVYMENSGDIKLPGGPITVFDGGIYAGDARIDTLVPGGRRLISYAVDLGVTVDASMKDESSVTALKIVEGVLLESRLNAFIQTYRMHNKSDEARQIIVEHPFNPSRKLVVPSDFEEKTARQYRFRATIGADQKKDFIVREEQTLRQQFLLADMSINRLFWYVENGEISPDVQSALNELVRIKQELGALQSDAKKEVIKRKEIASDQSRIRKNLETAGRTTTLGKRYLEKLGNQEDLLENIAAALMGLKDQIAAKEKELNDFLDNLNVN